MYLKTLQEQVKMLIEINFARIEGLSYCLTFVYCMDTEVMCHSYAVVGPSLNSACEVVMSLHSVGRYADIIVIF